VKASILYLNVFLVVCCAFVRKQDNINSNINGNQVNAYSSREDNIKEKHCLEEYA
jgi:hypothetical protein